MGQVLDRTCGRNEFVTGDGAVNGASDPARDLERFEALYGMDEATALGAGKFSEVFLCWD